MNNQTNKPEITSLDLTYEQAIRYEDLQTKALDGMMMTRDEHKELTRLQEIRFTYINEQLNWGDGITEEEAWEHDSLAEDLDKGQCLVDEAIQKTLNIND